jgi:hypothetical protein
MILETSTGNPRKHHLLNLIRIYWKIHFLNTLIMFSQFSLKIEPWFFFLVFYDEYGCEVFNSIEVTNQFPFLKFLISFNFRFLGTLKLLCIPPLPTFWKREENWFRVELAFNYDIQKNYYSLPSSVKNWKNVSDSSWYKTWISQNLTLSLLSTIMSH